MWFYCGIILISIGGIAAESCRDRTFECEKDIPDDIPQNEEELESDCSNLQAVVKCVVNVLEDCVESVESEGIKQYIEKKTVILRSMEQFLLESCNPDSSLYQVISSNLECAYPVLTNLGTSCELSALSENRKHVVDTYIELLRGRENSGNMWGCVRSIWDSACAATLVSDKCGSEILLPATEVFTSLDFNIQMTCDQEIKDGIPKFVELLAQAEEQAEQLENEILKKK